MIELYLHSPARFHDVVFNYLSAVTTLYLPYGKYLSVAIIMEGSYGVLSSNYVCINGTSSVNAMRLCPYSDSLANSDDFRNKAVHIMHR
jgi:hypothetical protein